MASQNQVLDFSGFKVHCSNCQFQDHCLPRGLETRESDLLEAIVRRRRPLARGEFAYQMGDSFRSLYVVRSGLMKTYTIDAGGHEHVTGFHFPGEMVGLDALADERHDRFARALDTTALCEIPYQRLDDLSGRVPGLRHQLVRLMSREIVKEEQMLIRLAQMPADQRLAAFFVQLAERFERLGFSPNAFPLKISNQDLGRYLGLASETVSRLLARLRARNLLTVRKRHVQIHALERLRLLARQEAGDADPMRQTV